MTISAVMSQHLPMLNWLVRSLKFTADWKEAMQGIYDFLGIELQSKALAAMNTWLESNNQHRHGSHKYSLADFGLKGEQVEQRLRFYRERFNIPFETKNPHLK